MKYWKWGAVAVALVGLFFAYAQLPLGYWSSRDIAPAVGPKFDTPDETINYFFAAHVAKTGTLAHVEPLNAAFTNPIVFMRWMQSPGVGSPLLYPGTFIGFIVIAAAVVQLFGIYAVIFITPLLSVGSVVLMYWLMLQVSNKYVAWWSAVFLAFLPPFFYYSSRTMFHTGACIFFLLLGVASYLRADGKYGWWFVLLSAFGFGGALFIRLSDIWWIAVVGLILVVARPIGWKKTTALVLMVLGGILGNLAMYKAVYGNWFTFGYPIPGFSASEATTAPAQLGRFILPFGFHPRLVWAAFKSALWQPYGGFILMALLGLVVFVRRHWNGSRRAVVAITAGLFGSAVYILCLYGSWSFSDSPTPGLVTIGSSYTRYFLPILVMLVPFAAYLVANGLAFLRRNSIRTIVSVFMVLLFGAWSWAVAYAGEEGLAHVAEQTYEYRLVAKDLRDLGATPDDIFLVRRGEDKILFPEFPRVVNIDYLPEDMVRQNIENFSGEVWVSATNHIFKKQNPFVK